MPDLVASSRPRRSQHFSVVEIDGEQILQDQASPTVLHLDRVAALVWSLCDGSRSVSDISSLLSQAYPESATQIEHDVRSTLTRLASHGCLSLEQVA